MGWMKKFWVGTNRARRPTAHLPPEWPARPAGLGFPIPVAGDSLCDPKILVLRSVHVMCMHAHGMGMARAAPERRKNN